MQPETVKLTSLHAPPRNVRKHPPKQIDELARAIEMFGQTRPVVVDEGGMILAGNGLVLALRKLGRKEAAVYRLEGLSQAQKSKLILSDNRIYELGFDDHTGIMEILNSLGGDFEIPGFDTEILKSLHSSNGDATEAALSEYGIIPEAAVATAQNRPVPPGDPTAEPRYDDPDSAGAPGTAHQPQATAAEPEVVTCPSCGGTFTP
jgi:hypothetical protein